VAYLAIINQPIPVTGQDDAAKAQWFPIDTLPPLAFDHADIMKDAIKLFKKQY
jgi:8-oxo-dGTP diphosphatase